MTRFLAKFIDWLLLLVVMAVVLVPIGFLLAFGGVWSGDDPLGAFSLDQFVSNLVLFGLAIAYFAFLESSRGQTIGKMLLKLKVVGPAGERPSREEALKRNAYILVPIVPVIGSLAYLAALIAIAVTINNDVQARRGWHDGFAGGTRVIRTD